MNFLSSLIESGVSGWVAIEQADAERDRAAAANEAQQLASSQQAKQDRFNNLLITGVTLASIAGVVLIKIKRA